MIKLKQFQIVSVLKFVVSLFALTWVTTVTFAAEYTLVIQSSDYVGEKNFNLQRKWLDDVEKASSGRLAFELLPNKGLVDHNETINAMQLGMLDGHLTATGYFSDKDPAIALMGNTVGAWSDAKDLIHYLYDGGGNEAMRKFYEPYGIHFVGGYTSGVEAFVSKIPLDGVDDLKKVTMRSPDSLVSAVFSAAGAKPIKLSGSQVIAAIEKGTINAADYSVFSTNQSAGMNKIAPHPVYPGFHSCPLLEFSIADSTWQTLPPEMQDLLTRSIKDFALYYSDKLREADLQAVEEAKKDSSITIHNWSAEERKKFRAIAKDQWRVIAEKSPSAKLMYDSLTKFLKENNLL